MDMKSQKHLSVTENATPKYRRLDDMALIELPFDPNYLHQSQYAVWDEINYCFWIEKDSVLDTWLTLQNL